MNAQTVLTGIWWLAFIVALVNWHSGADMTWWHVAVWAASSAIMLRWR